ncbi:MAG: GAF domain-containing protein [Candidatus Sericytochromatia bacterium]|nr:GAF domain-containing protein [Candidatus Sericytochromatia bacterium]
MPDHSPHPLTKPAIEGAQADVTHHHAFLAQATERLNASIDWQDTVQEAGRLIVPMVADQCILFLIGQNGAIHLEAAFAADPVLAGKLRHVGEAFLQLEHQIQLTQVIVTAHSRHIPAPLGALGRQNGLSSAVLALINELAPNDLLLVPLLVGHRVTGVIAYILTAPNRRFGPDEHGVAEAFARRASVALDHARLYRRVTEAEASERRQARRLAILVEVLQHVHEAGLEGMSGLNRIAELVADLVGEGCGIRLLSTDGLWLETVAVHHLDPLMLHRLQSSLAARQRADEGLSAGVLSSGDPVFQPQVDRAVLLQQVVPAFHQTLDVQRIQGVMIVPLIVIGQTIGVLATQQNAESPPYTLEDLRILQAVASRVALTIHNIRLREAGQTARRQAEATADRLERLQMVTGHLSQAVTRQQVCQVVIEHGVKALGADAGVVAWLSADGTTLQCLNAPEDDVARLHPYAQSFAVSLQTPLCEAARRRKLVIVESRADLQHRYPTFAIADKDSEMHCWVAVPIYCEDRTFGVLGMTFGQARTFSPEDRAFMLALAQQSAQALERAGLFEAETVTRQQAEAVLHRRAAVVADATRELRISLESLQMQLGITGRHPGQSTESEPHQASAGPAMALAEGQISRMTALLDGLAEVSPIGSADSPQPDPPNHF